VPGKSDEEALKKLGLTPRLRRSQKGHLGQGQNPGDEKSGEEWQAGAMGLDEEMRHQE